MAIEQGKYGLWYSKGVGFATKEQAQAHEDDASVPGFPGSTAPVPKPIPKAAPVPAPAPAAAAAHKPAPTPEPAPKSPALWPGIIVAVVMVISLAILITKCTRASNDPERKAANEAATQEIKMQRLARDFVSKNLKDPGSAEFRNQSRLCGEVNAKNSFGGYTGFRRFMAANENMVVFEGDGRMEPEEFNLAWRKAC